MDPITIELEVACAPAQAFAVWTDRTGLWWPRSHTVSGDPADVVFEPRVGGRIYERTRDDGEHDWGAIVAWEPPHRLVYRWHLMFDPADATTVEITFAARGDATAVRIVHDGWDELGEVGATRRDRNRQGWAGLLPHYREAVGGPAGRVTGH